MQRKQLTSDNTSRAIKKNAVAWEISSLQKFPVKCQLSVVSCPRSLGFGLIEVVIASAVLSVSLLGISSYFQATLRASRATESAVQGDYLLEEGVEVVKLFRDMSYTNNLKNMSTTTNYFLSWTGTTWASTTVNTFIDGKFERKITFTDVNRDVTTKNISSSGSYDPDIKLVTVFVSWWNPVVGTTTRSIQTYVTNILNN